MGGLVTVLCLVAFLALLVLLCLVAQLFERPPQEAKELRLKWTGADGAPLENNMATIKQNEWIRADLEILDSQVPPQPAKVDGVPVWSFDGDGFVEMRTAPDGMSAEFHDLPGVDAGVGVGTVTVDADLGEGVKPLSVPFEVIVEVDPTTEAVTLRVVFGDPQPQVPEPV